MVGEPIGRLAERTPVKAVKMNRIEKARGNIETLKDSLILDWNDLALPLTAAQRIDIETHLEWCLAEMSWCLADMKNNLRVADAQTRPRALLRPFDPTRSSWSPAKAETDGVARRSFASISSMAIDGVLVRLDLPPAARSNKNAPSRRDAPIARKAP
jgi:hypothetical protein